MNRQKIYDAVDGRLEYLYGDALDDVMAYCIKHCRTESEVIREIIAEDESIRADIEFDSQY